jgi:hypothetical protein
MIEVDMYILTNRHSSSSSELVQTWHIDGSRILDVYHVHALS